ncbi:hypothetical protein AB1Y20_021566 [Prymnesium parvum]|uniref:Beta-galactosidase n=1 Tax=Prymnesium parvum TaxID=97485 RepID=A0AB34JMM7_PRYPA
MSMRVSGLSGLLQTLPALLLSLLPSLLPSVSAVSTDLEHLAEIREAEGVYHRSSPGRWAGGAVKPHEPRMTWSWTLSGGTVRVQVPHAAAEVDAVYVRDQHGRIVAGKLLPRGAQVDVTLEVPAGTIKLTAFASSAIDGVWKSPEIDLSWTETRHMGEGRVIAHTPALKDEL